VQSIHYTTPRQQQGDTNRSKQATQHRYGAACWGLAELAPLSNQPRRIEAGADRGGEEQKRGTGRQFSLGHGLLVDLEDMYGHARGGGELLVADVALEVLGLLVLDEDLLVVELAVAVVAEDLVDALLLLPHRTLFDA